MKKRKNELFAVLGLLALVAGLVLVKMGTGDAVLPYLLVGIGCGLFGHGAGQWLSARAVRRDPALEEQLEIDRNDERNVMLGERAKARAHDLMVTAFGALLPVFALLESDWRLIVLLCAAYLFVCGYAIFSRVKLEREM